MNNKIRRSTQNNKFTHHGHYLFQLLKSKRLRNDLYAFKINYSDILFHSSSITILSEPIFGWEIAFILFSKTPHIA